MKKTKKAYEKYLNEFYSDSDWYETAYRFHYLNCDIGEAWAKKKIGTAIRKHDPVAFNCGYVDWLGNYRY